MRYDHCSRHEFDLDGNMNTRLLASSIDAILNHLERIVGTNESSLELAHEWFWLGGADGGGRR